MSLSSLLLVTAISSDLCVYGCHFHDVVYAVWFCRPLRWPTTSLCAPAKPPTSCESLSCGPNVDLGLSQLASFAPRICLRYSAFWLLACVRIIRKCFSMMAISRPMMRWLIPYLVLDADYSSVTRLCQVTLRFAPECLMTCRNVCIVRLFGPARAARCDHWHLIAVGGCLLSFASALQMELTSLPPPASASERKTTSQDSVPVLPAEVGTFQAG